MSCVAIIPARGGSRRIARKNIRLFHGKPIIAYVIEAARASCLFDAGIWVSSEDPEILRIARLYDAGLIVRPDELAEVDGAPDCGTQEVTRHALKTLQRDGIQSTYACCLYATAALMSVRDLIQGFRVLERNPSASFAYSVGGDPLQDAGQFYWGRTQAFLDRIVLNPYGANVWKIAINRDRVCDINSEEDWMRAERMFSALKEYA